MEPRTRPVMLPEEAQELVSHLETTGRLWVYKRDDVWIRLHEGAVAFVLQLRHVNDRVEIDFRAVTWEEKYVERYLRWLVVKFTTYAWRLKIEDLLKPYESAALPSASEMAVRITRLGATEESYALQALDAGSGNADSEGSSEGSGTGRGDGEDARCESGSQSDRDEGDRAVENVASHPVVVAERPRRSAYLERLISGGRR